MQFRVNPKREAIGMKAEDWISVKDRLPENKQVVLIFGKVPSFFGSHGSSVMTAKFYLADKWNKQSFMHHRKNKDFNRKKLSKLYGIKI